jgi:membrane protease subunit (stomatin/prohibitin family)
MGIFDFLSKQFIDVIDWTEDSPGVLAFRYPMRDREIQSGAKLVVTETQSAMFVNEGKIADVFAAGTHTLTTNPLPILTNLQNWDKAFQSPFKSDVFFFSHREQTDQKWGTTQPITVRDPELGALRIRAHGVCSYKIADQRVFWTKLSGTQDIYTVDSAAGQIRAATLTAVSSFLASSKVPFIDMAASQNDFSESLKQSVAPALANYGLELCSFFVQSLSLPEELEKHLDRAASMKAVGDLRNYTQFQAADSLTQPGDGSSAQAGVGLGAGLAMGQMMAQSLASQGSPAAKEEDPLLMIERLGELLKKGLITQDEFDKKKAALLGKI